jgi:hypothetical protein
MAALRVFATGWRVILTVLLLGTRLHGQTPVPASQSSLFAQATSAMLERNFASPRVEYVVLDLKTRHMIAIRWTHEGAVIPVGSLLKPFVAIAYGMSHSNQFPVVRCEGRRSGCWRADGHGPMGLEQAIAESCNAYFLALAGQVAPDDLGRVQGTYDLPAPTVAEPSPATLIGLTADWRVTPFALAQAYAALSNETGDPVVKRLVAGMRMAALPGGTAARVGTHVGGVLAKTGTAPCIDHCVADGDGLVVVLAPATRPRWLILVRERGTTGAQTAEIAGKMLQSLENSDAEDR